MSNQSKNASGKGAFARGADLFASVMAAVATFFIGPAVAGLSLPMALDYATEQIGYGWDGLVTPLWYVACLVATFGFAQMAIAASLRLGMAKLATTIFRN